MGNKNDDRSKGLCGRVPVRMSAMFLWGSIGYFITAVVCCIALAFFDCITNALIVLVCSLMFYFLVIHVFGLMYVVYSTIADREGEK